MKRGFKWLVHFTESYAAVEDLAGRVSEEVLLSISYTEESYAGVFVGAHERLKDNVVKLSYQYAEHEWVDGKWVKTGKMATEEYEFLRSVDGLLYAWDQAFTVVELANMME